MSFRRVKIGFIGVGAMGQAAHLRNYASLREHCQVVACADLRQNLREAVAARYGIPRTYATGEELLAKEELDAVVASQPFIRHGILIPEIAKSGLPIFTEKPIASSVRVGEKIVAELKLQNTWLMVGYHKRSDLATQFAREAISALKESKELGNIRYVRLSMPPGDWIAGGFNDLLEETHERAEIQDLASDPWPDDLDEESYQAYNAFVNYYIHQINLLRYLIGENYTVTYADPAKVILVAHSDSGIPCVIEMQTYQTTLDWQESALVTFEKGYVNLTLPAPLALNRPGEVHIFKDSGSGVPQSIRPQFPWVHAMRNQALNFIKAVRGESPAPCLAEEALQDIKVARDYIRLLKKA